ncbi:MAG: protein phosphatase 2C domain-containing protein [Gammaproteobacteria bacterium]|jgi:protein phosphatase
MSELAPLRWSSACLTDVGKVRALNEDACLDLPQMGVWAVADGMGGHDAGEVASNMIVDALRAVPAAPDLSSLLDDAEDRLLDVNARLIAEAGLRGGGVTIGSTVAVLLASGRHCISLWAGDSRIYCYRDGWLTRLTRDHSQVEEWVEQGRLLREDAENHPAANIITRAVGAADELYLDAELHDLQHRDRFLLCSDGLYKELSEPEIQDMMPLGNCAEVCRALVGLALERGCRDNVTVVVVEFEEVR